MCGFVIVAAAVVRGQLLYPDPGTRPSFEVATVKQGHGAGQLYDLRLRVCGQVRGGERTARPAHSIRL